MRNVAGGAAIEEVRLRGSVVAYAEVACDRHTGGCIAWVGTVALHSGKRLVVMPSPVPHDVTDLELRARRQLAFIGRVVHDGRVEHVVYKHDRGRLVVLDQGADVAPTSLRVIGRRIVWTKAGADRSATFAGAGTGRCARPDTRTVVANHLVRVFTEAGEDRAIGAPTYGCLRRSGRTRVVTVDDTATGATAFALHSTVVAYARIYADKESPQRFAEVATMSLRTGRTRSIGFLYDVDAVTDLAVTSRRRVAFIGRIGDGSHAVYKHDGTALTRLDAGPQVGPTSLRIEGLQIVWTNGGAQRTASFA